MKKGLLFSLLILASQITFGQIAAWQLNGALGNETSINATTLDANLNTSTLSRGSGLNTSSLANSFSSTNFTASGTKADAITNDKFLQFTINAKSGYNVSLSTLDARFRRSSTGPNAFRWQYSTDGSNFTDIGTNDISYTLTTTGGDAQLQINLSSISALQNVTTTTTITLRLLGWGASATTGTFAIGRSLTTGSTDYSLALGGTVDLASGVADPNNFLATTATATQINLSWAQNGNFDNVMVAWNNINTFGTPSGSYNVNDPITGGGTIIYNGNGTSFNHTGLISNTPYYYKAWSVDGSVVYSTGVISNATTFKDEPTNHATVFSSVAGTPDYSAINISWADAIGGTIPDGYLIKASTTSFAAIVVPVDGTPESDATLVKNVAQGIQASIFSGLTESTTYYFKIYPYTNSGTGIDYKTDGTVPQTSLGTGTGPTLPNAWINEFHYDNSGTDANEFVEVIIPNSLTSPTELAKFSVVLYNGNGGAAYVTKNIGSDYIQGNIDNTNGFTYYYFNYTTSDGGIQNGAPDGLALGYDGSLIMFLSYEGTFTATGGVASGILSTDVGVLEDGNGTGTSIGLTGSGTIYSAFTWALLTSQTPGAANTSQALPVELTSFSATTIGSTVKLSWNTAIEVNNYGFEVERKVGSLQSTVGNYEKIGFVNGNGNTNSPKSYSYEDKNVTAGKYSYRLKQIDNDGQFEYSKTIEVDFGAPKKFELSQNYPNPFNPITTIRFNLPEAGNVKLTLFNILGQEIKTLVNEFKENGVHTINFDASELNSGMYIYKLEAGSSVQTRKMTLVK